jgi:5'-nucleotidase
MNKLLPVLVAVATLALAPAALSAPTATAHTCPKGKKHKVVKGKHYCVRVATPKPKPKPPVSVQLLAINDFHGNLEPPTGSSGRVTTGYNGTTPVTVDAGGVEYLATHVKSLRTQNPRNTLFVAAGDLIGASPLLSGLFHDEPTIESLNAMGLQISAVGNHEFDEGVPELLRIQFGGCNPADTCQDGTPFVGALFHYLAAGVAGLRFADEADTINKYAATLKSQGVQTIVVLIHEGGFQNSPTQTYNSCEQLSGDIVPIVDKLDAEVDVVISAHTHQAYNCRIRNMLVTSAASFGRLITQVKLTISATTKDVTAKTATNVIVTRDVAKDTAATTLVAHYNEIAGPIANRVVGAMTADINRTATNAGETALGDVIADAQLEATAPTDFGGAVVAFMNPGGIRADLTFNNNAGGEAPGQVTYNELFTVQPFNNVMTVATCTGAQLKTILEQQFDNPSAGQDRVLQVSKGFTYSYNRSAPAGSRVDAASIRIGGAAVVPTQSYRVAMNNFLYGGGDNFTGFRSCTNPLGGEIDLDVLVRYFQQHSPVAPGARDRITRTG